MSDSPSVDPADRMALDAGERAARDGLSPDACPYRGTGPSEDRARRLWARGWAYGRSVLRGAKP